MKIGQSLICTKRGCFFTFPNNASLLRKYHNCSPLRNIIQIIVCGKYQREIRNKYEYK